MKALVAGGSGQLGKTLVDYLSNTGIETISTNRDTLDITDLSKSNKFILQNRPTIIINCAAWTNVDLAEKSPERAHLVNANGAANLAQIANELSIKLIHISTDYVFGKSNKEVYFENDPHEPVNIYGETKALGEDKVLENCPDSIVLRVAWLYSPYGKNFVKSIVQKLLLDDNEIKVVADQYGQPTSCRSVSETIIQLLNRPELNGTFHGSSLGSTSRYEQAESIARLMNGNLNRIVPIKSSEIQMHAKRPHRSVLGHTRLLNESLDLPMSWEEDLAREIDRIVDQVKSEML